MFSSDFDPFEILKNEDVRKNVHKAINKAMEKQNSSLGSTASRLALLHLAHLSTSWVNVLGTICEWQNNKVIKQVHISQLNHLIEHPDDLPMVVEANFAVCAAVMFNSYSMKQIGENLSDAFDTMWYALKNLSLDKGFEESQEKSKSRKEKNMWNVLLQPIVLLMNTKYIIHTKEELCQSILTNIIEEGCKYKNIDSICTKAIFDSFMQSSVLNYFKNNKEHYKIYTNSTKDNYDSINYCIDFLISNIKDPNRIGL